MVALLARIGVEAQRRDPVLGTARLYALRQALGAAPPGLPIGERVRLLGALSEAEMNDGRMQDAIGHLRAGLDAMRPFVGASRPMELKLRFWLAVALMRHGRDANCVGLHNPYRCILPIKPAGQYQVREASREAIEELERILRMVPEGNWMHFAARWLLNIARMTLGEWPDQVPARWRVEFPTDQADFPFFENIAGRLGVDSFDLAGAGIADDFDGDGLLDLFSSTWDPRGPLRYWRNDGRGGFEERTEAAGLSGITGGLNAIHGDYDGDGDLDVFVLRGAWLGEAGRHPNSLLRNDGGRFTDVTFAAGLGEVHRPTQAAAFADYDLDGDLDLFIGNEGAPQVDAACQLFRNEGQGTFVDVAAAAGVTNGRGAKGVAWGDYDADGDPDLYVSNVHGPNRLYRNEGDGRFTDVAPAAGVTEPGHSFVPWFWDFDEDGHLDLLVNAYQLPVNSGPPHLWYVAASHLGAPHPADLHRLYKGDGRGGFTDVAAQVGLDRVTLPMAANFGDLDNDGWLDFYVGTGYPGLEGLIPNRMYRNDRGRRFLDVTLPGGFGHLQKGHGIAFADLDNDGDQDIWEQMGGFVRGDPFHNVLYENPGTANRYIGLELRGVQSNRFGVGARVTVHAGSRRIHRVVGFGGSFGGNPLRLHVGVGQAERVDVEIHWPRREAGVERFEGLGTNHSLLITEGRAEPQRLERPRITWR